MKRAIAVNTKRALQFALASGLAVAMAIPALAQQTRVYREGSAWVEETTGQLSVRQTLLVKLDAGNVNVAGGAEPSVSYVMKKIVRASSEDDARKQFERYRFTASVTGDAVVLRNEATGVWHGPRWRGPNADLTVQVPRTTGLVRLQSDSGNETVSGIAGRVEAKTGGGNINLDDIGGAVTASSEGGNVTIGNLNSDLVLKTGGGNIRIDSVKGRIVTTSGGGNIQIGSGDQAMTVETGGGYIEVKKCGGELKAQTGGGNLDLGQVLGRADLQSGGGSIRLASATGPVVASTGGGRVELLNLAQGAKAETGGGGITAEFLGSKGFTGGHLETPAGDIVVYLDSGLKATIKAEVDVASSRAIHSDFPEIKVTSEGGQFGPKVYYAEGNLNGGGPLLRIQTTTGSIDIRRARK